jgi:hypothetical protein
VACLALGEELGRWPGAARLSRLSPDGAIFELAPERPLILVAGGGSWPGV